jgi:hypothetical protein
MARSWIARGVVVHKNVRVGTGQNRRAVYLSRMGNRFAQAVHADDVIAQLGIEKRRHEMLLLGLVAADFRDYSLSSGSASRRAPRRAAIERPGLDCPRPDYPQEMRRT